MSPINNNFQDLFDQNDRSDLPNQLNWENMEAGIIDKMNKFQPKEVPSKKPILQSLYLWPTLFLLFSITTCVFFIENKTKQIPSDNPNNNSISNNSNDTANQRNEKKSSRLNSFKKLGITSENQLPTPTNELDKLSSNSITISSIQTIPQFEITPSKINEPSDSSENITSDSENIELMSMAIIDKIKSLPNKDSTFNNNDKPSKNPKKAHLILETGICFWNYGWGQSESHPLETNLASYQFQGLYQWPINSRTFLLGGIQYQQLNSRFNYQTTIPDYKLILKDTVVLVYQDVTTGEIEKVYSDVMKTVEAQRVIVHYNTTDLFKILLGGGKKFKFKELETEIFGGFALNVFSFNQGRTLYNGQLIDYNGSSHAFMNNGFYSEFFGGGRLKYYLNQKISLNSGLQIQQSLNNWSTKDNIVMYPFSVGINFGIQFGL